MTALAEKDLEASVTDAPTAHWLCSDLKDGKPRFTGLAGNRQGPSLPQVLSELPVEFGTPRERAVHGADRERFRRTRSMASWTRRLGARSGSRTALMEFAWMLSASGTYATGWFPKLRVFSGIVFVRQ